MERLRNDFISFSISDIEVEEIIKKYYEEYKIILEPHGAVGICAYEKSGIEETTISIETAHPSKFPEVIKKVIGIEPEIPENMKILISREENFYIIENNYEEFKKVLKEKIL
jgi:threonine synthase